MATFDDPMAREVARRERGEMAWRGDDYAFGEGRPMPKRVRYPPLMPVATPAPVAPLPTLPYGPGLRGGY